MGRALRLSVIAIAVFASWGCNGRSMPGRGGKVQQIQRAIDDVDEHSNRIQELSKPPSMNEGAQSPGASK